MTDAAMDSRIDIYLSTVEKWKEELTLLRTILLDCMLTEELKWGSPCYIFNRTNIAIIGGLKDYCVLSFFKGVLLNDAHGILIKPGENTQTVRLVPFTSEREITDMEPVLKAYIYEAIEVERAGLNVLLKKTADFIVPEEFQQKLTTMPMLKMAFDALTPGRQRAYLLHFAAPRLAKTREARVAKCIPEILAGKGLND